jgi:dye decolorizing peroxidase
MPTTPSRRSFIAAAGTGVAAGAAGLGIGMLVTHPDATESSSATFRVGARTPVTGVHQGGIVRPADAQPFGYLLALDLPTTVSLQFLPNVGTALIALIGDDRTDPGPSDLLPNGPEDLTVFLALGPRVVSSIDPSLPGSVALPTFLTDSTVQPQRVGGDVLLALYSSNPTVLGPVARHLTTLIPGAVVRWEQRVFRGPSDGSITRNPFGFLDGIVVSRTSEELRDNVWLAAADSPRLVGGTILCLRRFRLDVSGFGALATTKQEALVGRHRTSGAPLSGGARDDQVVLGAKSADGEYLVPTDAHARAAHPSNTGSGLMLRRSYSYDDGGGDAGLMFTSFQRELRSFSATLQRMEERDGMLPYCTATGGGSWLVLPGYTAGKPLGSTVQ